MTFLSMATRAAFRLGELHFSPAGGRSADVVLRRRLGWAAPAGGALAALVAVSGTALGDRPTAIGALALIALVALVPVLLLRLTAGILARLDAVVGEAESLRAELDGARKAREALRDLADHDSLTGLPNRGLLFDRLGLAITHCHRQASHLAVLFLDLDDFKSVNDSFGHGTGDRLLVEFATRLRGSVRAGDTVARLGGDEFVVLLDTVSGAADAASVAAKVRDVVRAPFRLDGNALPVTTSIGMSVYPADGASPDELLGAADAAMYRNKQREAWLRADAEARMTLSDRRPITLGSCPDSG